MSKNATEKENQAIERDFRTPHFKKVCSLNPPIFTPITSIVHKHSTLVRNFELVNGQPVSKLVPQESDSVKTMSKYRVGDFSIITLDNIGLQSLRPQHYTPDIDAMLSAIK